MAGMGCLLFIDRVTHFCCTCGLGRLYLVFVTIGFP